MNVCIVNYAAGNLFSVKKALDKINLKSIITSSADEICNADVILLPGVGSYRAIMMNLRDSGLDKVIKNMYYEGKIIVGVCLGMQLFFQSSEEGGDTEGLGLLQGMVKKLPQSTQWCVPHIGWSKLLFDDNEEKSQYGYFAHSYYVQTHRSYLNAHIIYGGVEIPSIIVDNNILGFQFHPELSGYVGLDLLRKYVHMISSNNLIKSDKKVSDIRE